ncbi:hypothetical protein V6Z12_D12G171800 [Gossypium hirsutum]
MELEMDSCGLLLLDFRSLFNITALSSNSSFIFGKRNKGVVGVVSSFLFFGFVLTLLY